MESYGAVGSAARKLLVQLAGRSEERTAKAFLANALTRASMALQRGNALKLQAGIQQLRIDQLQFGGGDMPICSAQLQSPASRRRLQQRLASAREAAAADPLDLSLAAAFHASMHAGGGAQAARSFQANRVTLEVAG